MCLCSHSRFLPPTNAHTQMPTQQERLYTTSPGIRKKRRTSCSGDAAAWLVFSGVRQAVIVASSVVDSRFGDETLAAHSDLRSGHISRKQRQLLRRLVCHLRPFVFFGVAAANICRSILCRVVHRVILGRLTLRTLPGWQVTEPAAEASLRVRISSRGKSTHTRGFVL